ncbi:SIMPL domain-containing protein [Sedimentitalea sp. XS_ASV28]|uniref:SIMPL domain-containing protein n=1 Tax=Sedimentitalea sp. XS_ASV28 TaxID=3241296 RepID=UPI003518499F
MIRHKTGLVALAVMIATTLAMPITAQEQPRQIIVTGEGEVAATPDMATITLGVTNEAREAKEAMAATSAAVAEVLERLTSQGIAQKDIQTQHLSLNPVWSGRGNSGNYESKITGFTASNMVMVRVRDLATLGTTLDAVISAGANDFNGLQFDIQEPRPLQDAARQAAVKDALAKAQLLADAAGITLGPIVAITEQGGGGARPMMMQTAAMMAEASVPVAAGELSLSALVSVVFAIAD